MTRISSQIRIDAPAENVWEVLADLESVQNFSPGVAKAYYTSKARTGVGAGRHCDLQNPSGFVEERITDWEPSRGYTIEIYESNAPLKTAFGRYSLEPDGQGTIFTFAVEYQLKFGPMGALMDAVMAKRQFQKSADNLVAGLKHFVETGELVGDAVPASKSA